MQSAIATDLGITYALVMVSSIVVCFALIMLLRPLLKRYALARPNARSSHITPTPQGGGIAVIAATVTIAALVLAIGYRSTTDWVTLSTVFAATAFIAAIGAFDDIKPIEVLPRLIMQSIAAGAVLWVLPDDFRLLPFLPAPAEWAVLLIAALWFLNLVNFMDGIDLMVVVEVLPIAAVFGILGLAGVVSPQEAIVAMALGGSIIGFAPFNRPVARLFLGDVGSLPIGLLIGWLLAMLAARGHLAAALLLPLYFIADATLTILRRIAKREPFWRAHRSHYYQRAVTAGRPVGVVVAQVFIVNLGLASLALVTVFAPAPGLGWLSLAAGSLMVGWLLWRMARGR